MDNSNDNDEKKKCGLNVLFFLFSSILMDFFIRPTLFFVYIFIFVIISSFVFSA